MFPMQRISDEQHIPAHGIRGVDEQCLTHECECEAFVALLGEDASAGEQAHQSIYRVGIGADGLRNGICGLHARCAALR